MIKLLNKQCNVYICAVVLLFCLINDTDEDEMISEFSSHSNLVAKMKLKTNLCRMKQRASLESAYVYE